MAKIRTVPVDPIRFGVVETVVGATPLACSRAVEGYLRSGCWMRSTDVLYFSGYPEDLTAFMLWNRLVIGPALILGAGSSRRGLKTPASISVAAVEAIVRFDDFPAVAAPVNSIAEPRPWDFLQPRHPVSIRTPL